MRRVHAGQHDDFEKLIRKVRHRLIRLHFLSVLTIFLAAGLVLVACPLVSAKFRVQSDWQTSILPIITLSLACLMGLVCAWLSRPSNTAAARCLDRTLGTQELFLTATDNLPVVGSTMHALFRKKLGEATAATSASRIVPARVTPALKLVAVLILVDAALFATPHRTPMRERSVEQVHTHISALRSSAPLEDKLATETVKSLENAVTPNDLEDAARVAWREIQAADQRLVDAAEEDLTALKRAMQTNDKNRATEVTEAFSRKQRQVISNEARNALQRAFDKIRQQAGEGFAELLDEARKSGGGEAAARGGRFEKEEREAAARRWVGDLVLSVFQGLGKAAPDSESAKTGEARAPAPKRVPGKLERGRAIESLGLSRSEERIARRYLELRRQR